MMMRVIATLLVVVLVFSLVPAEAIEPPIRFPHETVAWSSPRADSAYTLSLRGAGLTQQSFNFTDPASRPICFTWKWAAGSTTHVVTSAWAMARSGALIARGAPIPYNHATTLEFITTAAPNWNTSWRTVSIMPRIGTRACLITDGRENMFSWLTPAMSATTDPYLRALMESGATYFAANRLMFPRWANYADVWFERRPSMLFISSYAGYAKIDVLQEPLAWLAKVEDRYGNTLLVSEQIKRWRGFRLATAIQAGLAEAQALALVTQHAAVSAPYVLLEAAAVNEPIVTVRGLANAAQITPYDAATGALIQSALAAGATVIATAHPFRASTGWTGTAWIAYNATNSNTWVHASTYLNTVRGGLGVAAPNPDGRTQADQMAMAKDLTELGQQMAGLGYMIANSPIGPTGQAIGLGLGTVGLGITLYGLKLQLDLLSGPRQGHVDIDEGPTGVSVSSGPGAGDAGGPAGSAPSGPSGDDGVGMAGTDGPCCAPGFGVGEGGDAGGGDG
jgi:hypothetical protein